MYKRGAIRAVLNNFLETLTSRNSDCGGYWIFGLIVNELNNFDLDLLVPVSDSDEKSNLTFFRSLSVTRFQEQMSKARLDVSAVRTAHLKIQRRPDESDVRLYGHANLGHPPQLSATALSNRGRAVRCEKALIVAPHDPASEIKSLRAVEPHLR